MCWRVPDFSWLTCIGCGLKIISMTQIERTYDDMFEQHAVMVRFDYGQTDLSRLFQLEDQLTEAIEAAGAGMFDGDEIATDGSDGTLFMYGPDADKLFEVVRPVLASTDVIRNIVATLRYGPPGDGVKQREVAVAA